MKVKVSFPLSCQKPTEEDDEYKLHTFREEQIATEVAVDILGKEWKGYMVQIRGENNKQGFP